jgi:DNA-binding response OmpR family regulator
MTIGSRAFPVPKSILISSKNDNSARVLDEHLTAAGFDVLISRNQHQTVDWVRENHTDLLIIEPETPDIDGIEITKELRDVSQLAPLPIIVISRNPSVDDIERSLNSGVDCYVSAPYRPKVLIAHIRAILRRVAPSKIK